MNHILDLEIPPTDLSCSTCGSLEGRFRCLDCYGQHWMCQGCLVNCHAHHPFHRPQEWKDGSFENVSLCKMGYVFVLGSSSSGCRCTDDDNMFGGDRQMTIVHVNGIFEHCVRFCKCLGANSEHIQLFDHRLFSATFDRPETAFTLDVLEYYGIDAMECKTSAQSFFQKLRRVTNNAFPEEVPVSLHLNINYPQLLLIIDNRTDTKNLLGSADRCESCRFRNVSERSTAHLPLLLGVLLSSAPLAHNLESTSLQTGLISQVG